MYLRRTGKFSRNKIPFLCEDRKKNVGSWPHFQEIYEKPEESNPLLDHYTGI